MDKKVALLKKLSQKSQERQSTATVCQPTAARWPLAFATSDSAPQIKQLLPTLQEGTGYTLPLASCRDKRAASCMLSPRGVWGGNGLHQLMAVMGRT